MSLDSLSFSGIFVDFYQDVTALSALELSGHFSPHCSYAYSRLGVHLLLGILLNHSENHSNTIYQATACLGTLISVRHAHYPGYYAIAGALLYFVLALYGIH